MCKGLHEEVRFQFTLSRRERRTVKTSISRRNTISIHTLTKRATNPAFSKSAARRYFNSHSHEESDCIILLAFERIIPYINFSRLNFFYCTYSIKLKKRLNEVRTSYINYNSLYFALIY